MNLFLSALVKFCRSLSKIGRSLVKCARSLTVSNIYYKAVRGVCGYSCQKSDVSRSSSKSLFPLGGNSFIFLRRNDDLIIVVLHGAHGELRERKDSLSEHRCRWGAIPLFPLPLRKHLLSYLHLYPSAAVLGYTGMPVQPVSSGRGCNSCNSHPPHSVTWGQVFFIFLILSFLPRRGRGCGNVE